MSFMDMLSLGKNKCSMIKEPVVPIDRLTYNLSGDHELALPKHLQKKSPGPTLHTNTSSDGEPYHIEILEQHLHKMFPQNIV